MENIALNTEIATLPLSGEQHALFEQRFKSQYESGQTDAAES